MTKRVEYLTKEESDKKELWNGQINEFYMALQEDGYNLYIKYRLKEIEYTKEKKIFIYAKESIENLIKNVLI